MSQQSNSNQPDSSNNQAVPADFDVNMEPDIGIMPIVLMVGQLRLHQYAPEEQILMELEFHLKIHREFGEYREAASARLDHLSAEIE
jgi:hypothetical protein